MQCYAAHGSCLQELLHLLETCCAAPRRTCSRVAVCMHLGLHISCSLCRRPHGLQDMDCGDQLSWICSMICVYTLALLCSYWNQWFHAKATCVQHNLQQTLYSMSHTRDRRANHAFAANADSVFHDQVQMCLCTGAQAVTKGCGCAC